jgi:phosphoglycolate phosphatase-like HAD superfamily hydrolase
MQNPHKVLDELQPRKEFFIGIDSDGCVFDTMEIKQKECFYPNTVKYWDLQFISEYVWDATKFVNLYSKFRGVNRFPSLIRVMNLLREHPGVIARQATIPDMTPLIEWIQQETRLGNPVLKQYMEATRDPLITTVYKWSEEVNATVKEIVSDIPPFSFVRESLGRLTEQADAVVVSQTPCEALEREWKENDVDHYVRLIAGQEYGTKAEHLKYAAKGKYADGHILMIGDAPGDLKAAQTNGVLFYPINPGHETASWERFYTEALDKFFAGTYAGEYENTLIEEFDSYLPTTPPWKKK